MNPLSQPVPSKIPLRELVITWVLLFPLLVFASQVGFSFERGGMNTALGAKNAGVISATDSGQSSMLILQTAAVYGICCIVMVPYFLTILADYRRDLLFSALQALILASVLWSQSPKTTIYHGACMIVNIAFAFYLLRRFNSNDLMKLLMLVGAVTVVMCFTLVIAFPRFGIQNKGDNGTGAWIGMFPQKNIAATVLTYLILPAFFVQVESKSAKRWKTVYIVSCMVLIAMSRSVGGWIVLFCCIGFIYAMKLLVKMPKKDATFSMITFFATVVAGAYTVFLLRAPLLKLVGKNENLTGRTVIWASLATSVMKRPWLGYGYMSFWRGLRGESAFLAIQLHWPGIAYAENGVLEIWLEIGLVGVIIFLLIFFRSVKDAIYCMKRNPSPMVMWYATLLFLVAISNVEAGNILYPSNLQCMLPILAYVGLRREALRLQAEAAMPTFTPTRNYRREIAATAPSRVLPGYSLMRADAE